MFGMALILIVGHYLAIEMSNSKIETYSLFISIVIGLPYLLILSNSDKFKKNKTKK